MPAIAAASRKLKLPQKASTPNTPTVKSAMPTSYWNGLTAQPMFFADSSGKNT